MRHTEPAATCQICQPQIQKIVTGQTIGLTTKEVYRKHKAALNRRLYTDELRSWGLKKNRYDGHWE